MPRTTVRTIAGAALLAGAVTVLLAPAGARAQGFGQGGGIASGGFQPPVSGGGAIPKPGLPPPPALPGAAGGTPAAPADKMATDLSPNDALFDAIDRGDMGGARDALSRGADLEAVNVLGMTPLEASVDLGRNDITFLLLSLRGSASSGRPGVVGPSTAAALASTKGAGARVALSTRVTSHRPARPSVEAPLPRVRYAVSDGNISDPKNGFLGFGP